MNGRRELKKLNYARYLNGCTIIQLMKASNSTTNSSKEVLSLPKGVSWVEIIKALQDEKSQQFFKTIDPATFKLILDENSHSKVIKSILRTLKIVNPKNANQEYAEMTYGAMQKVAKMLLKQKE